MSAFFPQAADVAHLIQVALTPIFLISAIGVTLNVLTSRLARIVDRARAMESEVSRPDYQTGGRDLHAALDVLARRARYINAAITLITLSALFIALVVVMLFVNAFAHWDLAAFIAIMFILSMLAFAAAGADCLYAPGVKGKADIQAMVRAVAPKPLNVLVLEPGRSVAEFADWGVRRISVGGGLAKVAWGGMLAAAKQMQEGSFAGLSGGVSGDRLDDIFGGFV